MKRLLQAFPLAILATMVSAGAGIEYAQVTGALFFLTAGIGIAIVAVDAKEHA